MDNAILMLAGITLVIIIFVLIPELLRRKREREEQTHADEVSNASVIIEIPADVVSATKLPRQGVEKALKIELAVHLYATGILPFGPARRLAGINKSDFHFLLCQRQIERPYDVEDYEKDLAAIEKWEKEKLITTS